MPSTTHKTDHPAVKVISFTICPFVQRVTALLAAKYIAYDIEYISLSDKPQWFLDLAPHGQVPVLVTDDGTPLFESEAIIEYLEEAYEPLQPGLRPQDKALNRAWSALAAKHYLVQCSAQRSPDLATLTQRAGPLATAFDTMEARLTGTAFFGGDTLGLVDIAWLTLLHRAALIDQHTGYDFIGPRPKLTAWQQQLMDTGLAERSVAPDFETAFTGFYLSPQTYLGRRARPAETGHGCGVAAAGCCC